MRKAANPVHRFESLFEIHQKLGVKKPMHPLISVINTSSNTVATQNMPKSFVLDFYKITFEPKLTGQSKVKYGQQYYDFNDGGLFFLSPNQLVSTIDDDVDHSGFALFIHPDFLLGHPLAAKIKHYNFFSYSVNEALHLSEKEKETIVSLFGTIEEELKSRIDEFSQEVVLSQIDLLLNYANRFYKRQFITRKAVNNDLLQRLEELIEEYFATGQTLLHGVPTVKYFADKLCISPGYLSDILRSLISQNGQQYIHLKIIEKAKVKLSATELSVSEIAYELGFEHLQSFSKFFKQKVAMSPMEFRERFN